MRLFLRRAACLQELHAAARAAAEALVAAAEAAAPGAERAAALAPAQAAAAALQDARGGELALHALVGMRHDVAALAAALQGLSIVEAAALAAYLHRCLLRHGGVRPSCCTVRSTVYADVQCVCVKVTCCRKEACLGPG